MGYRFIRLQGVKRIVWGVKDSGDVVLVICLVMRHSQTVFCLCNGANECLIRISKKKKKKRLCPVWLHCAYVVVDICSRKWPVANAAVRILIELARFS